MREDLTGQRFGRWTVLSEVERYRGFQRFLCRCDCGTEKIHYKHTLQKGGSQSCGCLKRERAIGRSPGNKRHGCSRGSAEYTAWVMMKGRCYNPKNPRFPIYGGRGITVCERWQTFDNFLADMGLRPTPEHSIERKDNNLGYSPENCIWATDTEQARNRRTNQTITLNGETLTVAEWAERTGIGAQALYWRLHQGWPATRILAGPRHRPTWEFADRRVTTREAATLAGLSYEIANGRLRSGWTVADLIAGHLSHARS